MNSFHYFSWPTGKAIKAESRGFEEIELLQMSCWLLRVTFILSLLSISYSLKYLVPEAT